MGWGYVLHHPGSILKSIYTGPHHCPRSMRHPRIVDRSLKV
jgi:hypothetical protein